MRPRWSLPAALGSDREGERPHAAAHQNLRFRARADAPAEPRSRQFVFGGLLALPPLARPLLKSSRIKQRAVRKRAPRDH